MDEQRLERALRAGPPFASPYVARPLTLDVPAVGARGTGARLVVLLAVVALLLTATIVGLVLAGLFQAPAIAAVVRGDALYVVREDGQEQRILSGGVSWPTWSSDGQRLAVLVPGGKQHRNSLHISLQLIIVGADGTRVRELYPLQGRQTGSPCGLTWAPDDSAIALCETSADGLTTSLITVELATGANTMLASTFQPVDPADAWEPPDGPRPAPERPALMLGGRIPPEWSGDGEWLIYEITRANRADWPGTDSELWVVRSDGSDPRRLVVGEDDEEWPTPYAWSPASDAVAVVNRSGTRGVTIDVLNLEGRRLSTIVYHDDRVVTDVRHLAWSADGSLAYDAYGSGWQELRVRSADGADSDVLTTNFEILGYPDALWWSAPGKLSWLAPRDTEGPNYTECITTLEPGASDSTSQCIPGVRSGPGSLFSDAKGRGAR